ncbi:MAG TPA: penicillin-binding protein activator, partial [Kofleriaceae bacterium]|nr:penicillin-binding protein activator [Kofleriaceae bacterium]
AVDGAKAARDRATPVREKLGLEVGDDPLAAPSGPGDAGRLGAVLPQTSKQARLIEEIVRGLTVAAGSLGAEALRVRIEDAEGAATRDAVDRLVDDGVLAILGPTDAASVDAAAAEAASRGVPLLSFAARADERPAGGTYVFHVMHSAEARARALAARAAQQGLTRFAILRPKSGYGAAVGKAFADAVRAQGGTIVDEEEYPAEAKSFAGYVKKLGGSWQAVFVPDQADEVALVAPALAAAGFVARPVGTKKVTGGRPIVLLSTVEGADDHYVREAGRYSAGALLAPGYFPGAVDDAGAELERRFTEETGKTPTAIEAYAYDALRLCAALVADGARTRADLARRLATAQVAGVTGRVSFDADHRRSDPGVLYTIDVTGDTVTVRALR